MKQFIFTLLVAVGLIACQTPAQDASQITAQLSDMQNQISNGYEPSFGSLMNNIQMHHNKLYFAGENQNWKLAKHELKAIATSFEHISKYCGDREETKLTPMMQPALDSVAKTIERKSAANFAKDFVFLTNTCNNCHRASSHEFIVITSPKVPPFSNQEFRVQ
jgi:hypothetical protein